MWPGPSSAEGGFDLVQRWKEVIRDAIVGGVMIPQAFLVITGVSGHKQWQPLDWKLVREAQKAIMLFGIDNEHVRVLTEQVFTGQVLCLYDVDNLASMLLKPVQKFLL